MIEVKNLTKKYGLNTAVSDLNFTVQKGLIYGFLGPNGAGKSTTMNIITGCLAATEGEVIIDGHDIFEEPLEAKRLIGYLPEIPPLYVEMTPYEYLDFVAEAKGLPSAEADRQIAEIMQQTGITDVSGRLIGNLSKGYRQRVGIAQAMIGNPEIIILDEPTVGLDPKQIIEIRNLIRDLAENHTVILSSHILSEIQTVCDRVIIISNGHLVADDTIDDLVRQYSGDGNSILISAKCDSDKVSEILDGIDGILEYTITERGEYVDVVIITDNQTDLRETIFRTFAESGVSLTKLTDGSLSFEEIYLRLTEEAPSVADEPGNADLLENDENTADDSNDDENVENELFTDNDAKIEEEEEEEAEKEGSDEE